jgi:hypothetical protein
MELLYWAMEPGNIFSKEMVKSFKTVEKSGLASQNTILLLIWGGHREMG